MSEWISVKDRLPEIDGIYLIIKETGMGYSDKVAVCEYGFKYGFDRVGVTHWMPLPEPPNE